MARRRRPIPFWLHQLLEYLLAVGLVVLSVHVGRANLLLVGGVIFGVLALTARGPLGIVRVCGPRLHATLEVAAGVFLAGAPLVPPLRPGPVGIVVAEVSALAWLRVATLTRYPARSTLPSPTSTTGTPARPAFSNSSADAGRTGRSPIDRSPSGQDVSGQALSAMRRLGQAAAAAKSRLPETQTSFDTHARRIGEHAGRWQRAWRRAAR